MKLDILDLIIEAISDHERKLDAIVTRMGAILEVLEGHPEFSEALNEIYEQDIVEEKSLNVLIVDDDEFLASTFQMLLMDAGFKVDTTGTGEEALLKATQTPYDLAILDYKLPDILGFELSRRLKENDSEINVVILTGHAEAIERKTGFSEEEVLMKPISPDELLKITDKLKGRN